MDDACQHVAAVRSGLGSGDPITLFHGQCRHETNRILAAGMTSVCRKLRRHGKATPQSLQACLPHAFRLARASVVEQQTPKAATCHHAAVTDTP